MGSTNIEHDIPMYVDFAIAGLNMHSIVAQHINLPKIDETYVQLKSGEVIRWFALS